MCVGKATLGRDHGFIRSFVRAFVRSCVRSSSFSPSTMVLIMLVHTIALALHHRQHIRSFDNKMLSTIFLLFLLLLHSYSVYPCPSLTLHSSSHFIYSLILHSHIPATPSSSSPLFLSPSTSHQSPFFPFLSFTSHPPVTVKSALSVSVHLLHHILVSFPLLDPFFLILLCWSTVSPAPQPDSLFYFSHTTHHHHHKTEN